MMEVMTQVQQEVKKAMEVAKKQQPAPQPAPPAPEEQKQPQAPSGKQ
jgi:hypothetical protein